MTRRQAKKALGTLLTGSAACILMLQLSAVLCQSQGSTSQLLSPLRYSLDLPRGETPAADIEPEVRPAAAPSPAGRILDATATTLTAPATTSTNPAVSSSSPVSESDQASKAPSTPAQLVARKPAPINTDAVAAELKILNQHAHARPSSPGAAYQRLSLHRDTSSSNKWASEDTQASGTRDSPLSSLFDNFRSGISSRSSIVKAISDNKLARTISAVGKSLGGNKYMAGAAAASVLAALGLTVSKLSGSFMLSPKFADPMLGSGSYLSPTSLLAPRGYLEGTRDYTNFIPDQTTTSLAPASSEPPLFVINPSPMNLYSGGEHNYNPDINSMDQMSSSSVGGQSGFQSLYPRIYTTYTRQPAASSIYETPSSASVPRVALGDPQASSSGSDQSIRGHYSTFYENDPSSIDKNESPLTSSQSYDNLVSSASGNLPSFSGVVAPTTRPATNARRSGTVALKMDEATRQRLIQHLIRQQEYLRQVRLPSYPEEQRSNSERPQIAAIYVPAASIPENRNTDYNFRGITSSKQQSQPHHQPEQPQQQQLHPQQLYSTQDKQQQLQQSQSLTFNNTATPLTDGPFQPINSSS